ncbi:ABC transporter ATP-binding protein [Microbacterium sp. X-17]|uniref:ABC transporter ATP-binding protein n=1 Tax=Microbacterium sp. X-17 TaxID=3144404 RepID=UPI0031F4AC2E
MSQSVIQVRKLTKTYGVRTVVDGLDFDVRANEVFGLLGPNGAGKTTLIECIVGLRRPSDGTVSVLGLDPARERVALTSRVSVQPQSASLYETLTVDETLRLFASFYKNPRSVDTIVGRIGLAKHRHVRAKNLSGGQARRLLLGVSLIGNPEIVVLDEPSAGLDPASRRDLWATISELRDAGTTVLLSTHHMDEATTLCDRVAILVDGRIAALDSPGALVRANSKAATVSFVAPVGTADEAVMRHAPGCALSRFSEGAQARFSIDTAEPDELVRKLTFDRSITLSELSVVQRSLEDIFLQFASSTTGEGSPDE